MAPSSKDLSKIWREVFPSIYQSDGRDPLPRRTVTTPPIGWRCWKLVDWGEGPQLQSLTREYRWDGPLMVDEKGPKEREEESDEVYRSHPPGFYALEEREIAEHWIQSEVRVIGEVDLLGEVVVHERGFRAQGVRIRRLQVLNGGWEEAEKAAIWSTGAEAPWHPLDYDGEPLCSTLSDRYQCEVEWRPEGEPEAEQRSPFYSAQYSNIPPNITHGTEPDSWISDPKKRSSKLSPENSTLLQRLGLPNPLVGILGLSGERVKSEKRNSHLLDEDLKQMRQDLSKFHQARLASGSHYPGKIRFSS